MSYWHNKNESAWTCPDCGSKQCGEYYCEVCVTRTVVLVTCPGKRIQVDFDGTEAEAAAMVERHYPDAVAATLVRGKR